MGQMMFTKYIVVVDAGVNVHNTSEVLFHLTANTDPQRDSIFTKGPSDVLDHATSKIASGSKLGIDATKNCRVKVSNAPGRRNQTVRQTRIGKLVCAAMNQFRSVLRSRMFSFASGLLLWLTSVSVYAQVVVAIGHNFTSSTYNVNSTAIPPLWN